MWVLDQGWAFFVSGSETSTAMSAVSKLASAWEALVTVRKRFRTGAEWIHVPMGDDGQECLQSTPALRANFKILISIVEAANLEKVGVKVFERQAPTEQYATPSFYVYVFECGYPCCELQS